MIAKVLSEGVCRSLRFGMLCGSALLASGLGFTAAAGQVNGGGTLVVSRIQYVAPTPEPEPFPQIFSDPNVSGIQGNIFLDYYKPSPGAPLLSTLPFNRCCSKTGTADYHDELQLEIRGLAASVARRPLRDLYGI
jgi:hypothetical protein